MQTRESSGKAQEKGTTSFDVAMRKAVREGRFEAWGGERKDGLICKHGGANTGAWLVEWQGKLYSGLRNNLDVRMWADGNNKAENLAALRWYCFECATVQPAVKGD